MARELYTLMPDIICLQEAVRTISGEIDTAEHLSDFMGMHHIYAPARKKERVIEGKTHLCYSGLAVLTNLDIERSWTDTLVDHPEDPDRIALTVQLGAKQCYLTVTNTHLTHIAGQDDHRQKQLVDLIDINHSSTLTTHWFCCGDFNFEPDCSEVATRLNGHCLTMKDCYIAGNGKVPAGTLATTDAIKKDKRIDHILYLEREGSRPIFFTNGEIVLNKPDFEQCYPSDHFGVSVDFFFNTPAL